MENPRMQVRIVPMRSRHLDEVAELERICFSVPWSRNMLAEELDNALSAFLAERGTADVTDGCPLIALLRRPEIHYGDLRPFDPAWPALPEDVAEQVEISVKYAGYIQRQMKQVADFEKMERRSLPADLDYLNIQGLRLEAREKLAEVRPANLGQASRISGVSPADVAALMIYLER